MIVLMGRLTINPRVIKTYEADVKKLSKKVLNEDGCLYYSLVVEDREKATVSVSEMWRDESALFVHWGQAWVTGFMEKYGSSVTSDTLQMYDASNQRDLPS